MDTGITKGDWGVEQTSTRNWIGVLKPSGKIDKLICSTDREDLIFRSLAENDANAKLIAAAPELLGGCIHAFEMCNDPTVTANDMAIMAGRLRQKINKALGRTKT